MATRLYQAKQHVYLEAIRDVAQQLGILPLPTELAPAVLAPLNIESRQHSRSIVKTFNKELAEYAFSHGRLLDEGELGTTLRAWIDNRNATRAGMIAVTETYGPYADAIMASFRDAGLEDAKFDFGGHPELGDEPPECIICAALEAKSPHPLAMVVKIGNPHPNCRQAWHAVNPVALRARLTDKSVVLGRKPSGIVGKSSLIHRAGSREAAARAIRSGRIPR